MKEKTPGQKLGNEPVSAGIYNSRGLLKREHFAGLAMQALVSNPSVTETDPAKLALAALDLADNLLDALAQV